MLISHIVSWCSLIPFELSDLLEIPGLLYYIKSNQAGVWKASLIPIHYIFFQDRVACKTLTFWNGQPIIFNLMCSSLFWSFKYNTCEIKIIFLPFSEIKPLPRYQSLWKTRIIFFSTCNILKTSYILTCRYGIHQISEEATWYKMLYFKMYSTLL